MVHSVEGPPRPTRTTPPRATGPRRRQAWSLPRAAAKTAHRAELDWDHFRDLYYADSRRHSFEAIVAYGDYKSAARLHIGGGAAALKDAFSADVESLGEWEGEGGASRDPSSGRGER
jgi:hypothetical protein